MTENKRKGSKFIPRNRTKESLCIWIYLIVINILKMGIVHSKTITWV